MIIVTTGSREWGHPEIVNKTLNRCLEQFVPSVFVGDCQTGADRHVVEWCDRNRIIPCVFRADWQKHGKSAGPRRNREMLKTAQQNHERFRVVGFVDSNSRGTRGCLKLALEEFDCDVFAFDAVRWRWLTGYRCMELVVGVK